MLGAWPTALYSTSASTSSNSNSIVAVSLLSSNLASSSSASSTEKKEKKNLGKSTTTKSKIPSGIHVSRQKYIPVSKPVLLDALVGKMFSSEQHLADQFVRVSSCLDSILHAVHKDILEEMRADYLFTQSIEGEETASPEDTGQTSDDTDTDNNGKDSVELCAAGINGSESGIPSLNYLDMMNVFDSANNIFQRYAGAKSSVIGDASATRFQRSFMKLLRDAQFEELSARDLMLTSALNTDYLLTLPVYVDWEKASESNAIIFRRGYTTEKQRGLLVVNKLDYLQSKLIQAIFGFISKPLVKFGIWINEAIKSSGTMQEIQSWMTRVQLWTDESSRKSSFLFEKQTKLEEFDQHLDDDLPLGLASQRAVNLYEGLLSPEGPRSRLLRKFLSSIGLIKPTSVPPLELHDESSSEAFLRSIPRDTFAFPFFLSTLVATLTCIIGLDTFDSTCECIIIFAEFGSQYIA